VNFRKLVQKHMMLFVAFFIDVASLTHHINYVRNNHMTSRSCFFRLEYIDCFPGLFNDAASKIRIV
jgi:hypothetical protein